LGFIQHREKGCITPPLRVLPIHRQSLLDLVLYPFLLQQPPLSPRFFLTQSPGWRCFSSCSLFYKQPLVTRTTSVFYSGTSEVAGSKYGRYGLDLSFTSFSRLLAKSAGSFPSSLAVSFRFYLLSSAPTISRERLDVFFFKRIVLFCSQFPPRPFYRQTASSDKVLPAFPRHPPLPPLFSSFLIVVPAHFFSTFFRTLSRPILRPSTPCRVVLARSPPPFGRPRSFLFPAACDSIFKV